MNFNKLRVIIILINIENMNPDRIPQNSEFILNEETQKTSFGIDGNTGKDRRENNQRSAESYDELKKQLEEKVPDYEKFIPQNKLVKEIPGIECRERGVRYFNDEELMERVKRIDLLRILKGERIITSTPVNKVTFEQELGKLKKNADFMAKLYSASENISYEQAYERAKKEEIEKYLKRTKIHGGGYASKTDEIVTYDKFTPEDLEDRDEAIFPHEDMHAFFAQNSKYLQSEAADERRLDILNNENQLLVLKEKEIEKELSQQAEIGDPFSEKALGKAYKDRSKEKELTNIYNKKRELRRQIEVLREKIKISPDIIAVEEGFAFAVSKYYSGWNPDNFDGYEAKTDPDLIARSRDLSEKIISIIGIEPSKKLILTVIDESCDEKTDAVKLLEEKFKIIAG